MNRRFLVLLACAALAGCASSFDRPSADHSYGSPPVRFADAVKAHFDEDLKDPESARYKFGFPKRAFVNNGLIYGGKVAFTGYIVDVQVNAKNSFGGYTGFKPYMAFFNGEQLVKVMPGSEGILVHRVDP